MIRIRKWTIREVMIDTDIRVKVDDGWHSEWPIRYWDGRVAWDHPELIPADVRRVATAMLANLNRRLSS